MDATGMGAGVNSTALDVAKFGQMLPNRGAYGDQRFFRAETFQKMLPRPLADLLGPDTKERWGIGLRQYDIEGLGGSIYGHNAASETILRVDLDHQLVIVMCRNRPGKNFAKYRPWFFQAVAECVGK